MRGLYTLLSTLDYFVDNIVAWNFEDPGKYWIRWNEASQFWIWYSSFSSFSSIYFYGGVEPSGTGMALSGSVFQTEELALGCRPNVPLWMDNNGQTYLFYCTILLYIYRSIWLHVYIYIYTLRNIVQNHRIHRNMLQYNIIWYYITYKFL